MGTNFTEEQKQAIYITNKNILVAAAAGSGKTAVLVERIINLITNPEKPIDADKLVVVTFTRAAASEMRLRISRALLEALDKNPTNEYLRKQTILLNKATISTMDSFCQTIVRKYFYLLDIDPSFKIIDQTEEKLIKIEVLDTIFEDEYAKESNQIFFDVIESYGGTKTKDDGLSKLILKIYNLISNIPWYKDWLNEKIEMYNPKSSNVLTDYFWFTSIKDQTEASLSYALCSTEYAINIAKSPNGPYQYLDNLIQDRALILELIKANESGYECMYNALEGIGQKFTRLSSKKEAEQDPSLKELVKKLRDFEIKKPIIKLKEDIYLKPMEQILLEIKELYPILKKIESLVLRLAEEYKNEKLHRNLINFSDAGHYCLEILFEKQIGEDGNQTYYPSKTALEISRNFEQIMIDEYQDSNIMQELIFSSISQKHNRFMVGDIKQSIYRFRGANPNIFLEKYNQYEKDSKDNIKVDLSKNFRSVKNVLETVNFFFYQLMNKEIGKIDYDEKVALHVGTTALPFDENMAKTEVLLAITNSKNYPQAQSTNEFEVNDMEEIEELSRLEMEGEMIALKIKELMQSENPFMVLDNETKEYRKTEFRDIVIIMRSITSADTLVNIFKNHNIPLLIDLKSGYFQSIEVSTVLSFLQIIDNPKQDIHLIAVLRSPVYMLNADELLEIRNYRQDLGFYDCISGYLEEANNISNSLTTKEKLEKFMKDLQKWRKDAMFLSISTLLFNLFEETSYSNYIGVMPGGEVRQANLKALLEKAMAYEDTSLKGLFHFIKYMERLQKTDNDMEIAKIVSENENIVRLMTIHKSKGLEYPIVFVSQMGKKFNTDDKKDQILMHHQYGFGPNFIDLTNRVRSKSIGKIALIHEIHKENMAEEMRMFYVALTRAKEKLILTGVIKDIETKTNDWKKHFFTQKKEFDAYFLLKCNSYLEWVCAALARHKDGGGLRGEASLDDRCNKELFQFPAQFKITIFNKDNLKKLDNLYINEMGKLYDGLKEIEITENYSGKKEEIDQKFSFIYPFSKSTTLPTKISISEIKRLHQKELIDQYTELNIYEKPIYNQPAFKQKNKTFTPAQIGTITHTIMEHLDFSKTNSKESIEELILHLVEKNILTKEESLVVPFNKIVNFTNSSLAKRMSMAAILKREVSFVMGLSPYEIYKDEALKENKDIILVHGILDCFFYEDNEIVIVDYKSDYISNIDYVKEKYKIQLEIYKKAVEKSTKTTVKECILYSFHLGKEIRIF